MFCYTWYISSKQPYEIFPFEIWEVVVDFLQHKESYELSRTSRLMCECIRHVPIQKQLKIETDNLAISSFFKANTRSIHIWITPSTIKSDLRHPLNKLYYLDNVTFLRTSFEITVTITSRLLPCLPVKKHHGKRTVYVDKKDHATFDNALAKLKYLKVNLRR